MRRHSSAGLAYFCSVAITASAGTASFSACPNGVSGESGRLRPFTQSSLSRIRRTACIRNRPIPSVKSSGRNIARPISAASVPGSTTPLNSIAETYPFSSFSAFAFRISLIAVRYSFSSPSFVLCGLMRKEVRANRSLMRWSRESRCFFESAKTR